MLDRMQSLNETIESMPEKYGRISSNIQTLFMSKDAHMYGYYLPKLDQIVLRKYQ